MSPRSTPAQVAGSPSRPRPLRADAERNRQRLIAAARQVFADRGLEVTLDDIARHAGVGVGTAYRRFADREALIEAVFDSEVQRIVTLAERALGHEDAWSGLVEFLTASGRDFAEDRGLREVLLHGTHGESRIAASRNRLTPAVGALIARAQREGSLRDDFEATDLPLIQLMIGAAAHQTRTVTPGIWQRYLTLILDGLRAERDAPSPLPHRALTQDEFEQSVPRTVQPRAEPPTGRGTRKAQPHGGAGPAADT
ncbi:MAG TPA: helix-turn-helix domain-containing protein [Streptomyces sp.]|uniref:TetR/AcrR family transcriptional regulator n=1 Tax=Streptomyces sp. TaxID=1931 RepID=UPI002D1638C1|nr:helix-turn-helix domain-containing protein [Streptomyces sp.]HWU06178.1 helix-turn-helix domain-containing protein [Streptomyces sp.]